MTRALGDITLTMVNGGDFRLDGGAMHGVVPKTIWSSLVSCDDRNRCSYSTNCLLIESAGRRILVDTGNGDKLSPKLKDIYGIDHDRSICVALAEIGVEPRSIDVVVFTHLHFDHAGGATRSQGPALVPVFSRARHIVQRAELEAARSPHERNRASYVAANFEPLATAGLLEIIDGAAQIAPGVSVVPTPGHSHGHQSVLVDGGDGQALFCGDVMPTSVHVRLPFIMAYDLDVEATLRSKQYIHQRAIDEGWLVLFDHDRRHGAFLTRDDSNNAITAELVDV